MENAHYSYVLLFITLCAIFVTLTFKIRVPNFWRVFFLTDVVVLLVYLAWDFWAISRRNWYFDQDQILGIYLFAKIPIEEMLFFIIVPLMTIITYLALQKLTGWRASHDSEERDI